MISGKRDVSGETRVKIGPVKVYGRSMVHFYRKSDEKTRVSGPTLNTYGTIHQKGKRNANERVGIPKHEKHASRV
jgi:hypothetical protein